MDDMDLSNVLRFDLTNKDDRMLMYFVTIVSFSHWPHTTVFSTLLCLAQIHFDFVPQDHNYWNGLARQAAATWLLSMQLGKLSEAFVGYCRRNARDACKYTVKLLLVWPGAFAIWVAIRSGSAFRRSIIKCWRFVTSIRARLARALVAFKDDIDTDISDDESDHGTLDDFHEDDSMYESEYDTEPDSELEYDSDISNEEVHDLSNVEDVIANEDTSTVLLALTADTAAMMPSGLDQPSSRIRSGSQSSNVRNIENYFRNSSEELDAHRHSE
jgi:hypothetical protein